MPVILTLFIILFIPLIILSFIIALIAAFIQIMIEEHKEKLRIAKNLKKKLNLLEKYTKLDKEIREHKIAQLNREIEAMEKKIKRFGGNIDG